MTDERKDVAGSERAAPRGLRALGRVAGDQPITVSLYLKPADAAEPAAGEARAALHARRTREHADDFAAVAAFAQAHALTVVSRDPARRLVQLAGPAAALERAFGTELDRYAMAGGAECRARSGPLSLPAALAARVTAVLGLDTRPVATPKIVPHRGPAPPRGFLPTEVAALYGIGGLDAAGECVAIVELGGGYTAADNEAAFAAMGLPVPTVVAVPVDGGANAPGGTDGADGEVALDIQVVGGVAPGARIAVYFAPNTSQGFADAISQAVHDPDNKPAVISISWGGPENGWSGQAIAAMHQAFADAAALGVSVFAASGDNLATDGAKDGKAHVDYPASDPLVVGCGGTRLAAANGKLTGETVWKSNGGGTGGGVSAHFARPAYQAGVKVPTPPAKAGGRGVPDVAGDADPDSGYRIVTGGSTGLVGGTSAVAPLWAGLFAGLNAARGKPLGQPHALLYAHADQFRDIVAGDNKVGAVGFAAGTGWDACTGLGSPAGAALKRRLGKAAHAREVES